MYDEMAAAMRQTAAKDDGERRDELNSK